MGIPKKAIHLKLVPSHHIHAKISLSNAITLKLNERFWLLSALGEGQLLGRKSPFVTGSHQPEAVSLGG